MILSKNVKTNLKSANWRVNSENYRERLWVWTKVDAVLRLNRLTQQVGSLNHHHHQHHHTHLHHHCQNIRWSHLSNLLQTAPDSLCTHCSPTCAAMQGVPELYTYVNVLLLSGGFIQVKVKVLVWSELKSCVTFYWWHFQQEAGERKRLKKAKTHLLFDKEATSHQKKADNTDFVNKSLYLHVG